MDQYHELVTMLALTLGVGWASGVNLYAAVLTLGLLGASGTAELPPALQVVEHPMVIGAAGLMYCVEFFTDKVPGVDTGWDALHTFVRIPAGAMLAAGVFGEAGPALEIAAGLVGGGMAAGSHATKAGTRALVNTSPEPFSNWSLSIAEDVMVIGGVWAALHHPEVMLVLMIGALALMIWLLPKLFRALARVYRRLRDWLAGEPAPAAAALPDAAQDQPRPF
ncbi:MAG: hypothetical protein CMN28_08285 [Salinisphaeraceae bacterium]|nr:hypothetical protein [Salinisphaeraceae bacterium]